MFKAINGLFSKVRNVISKLTNYKEGTTMQEVIHSENLLSAQPPRGNRRTLNRTQRRFIQHVLRDGKVPANTTVPLFFFVNLVALIKAPMIKTHKREVFLGKRKLGTS